MDTNGKLFQEKLDVKRGAEEIQRERELMAVELEGRLDSLLGGQRDLRQRLRVDKRERKNSRYKSKSLVRYIDEADGIVR